MAGMAELSYVAVPDEEMSGFYALVAPIFHADQDRKGLSIPEYHPVPLCVVAKTADGRVAGGLVASAVWGELRLLLIAANPECRVPGTGTALMKHAEEAARTQLGCHKLSTAVYDWQPRRFFERCGLSTYGSQANHPRGHTKYLMEKVLAPATSGDAATCYAAAATDLIIDAWEESVASPQLRQWCDVDAAAHATPPVPPHTTRSITFKALYPDGSMAAASASGVLWNELHAHIIVVAPDQQRRGVGTTILRRLEELAHEHRCDCIVLETMSWQAKPFYERNGYVEFATQHDIPSGHRRHRMIKVLTAAEAEEENKN